MLNTTDFFIILLLITAAFDGWRSGILVLLADLAAFAIGLFAAYWLAVPIGSVLGGWLNFSAGLQPLFGFALSFLVVMGGVRLFLVPLRSRLIRTVPELTLPNQVAGASLNVVKQLVAIALTVNLLLFLPVLPFVRADIQQSQLAPYLVLDHGIVEPVIAKVIEAAVYELQGFMTTKTIAGGTAELKVPAVRLSDDHDAERALLTLVNQDRATHGLRELEWNEELAKVARIHSRDMWRRQYFSHVNPDGADPFDRLRQAGISYLAAGENLALAPNTTIAHKGLMESPDHRDNILSPEYGQIGIGVARNGLYGATYTQEFMN